MDMPTWAPWILAAAGLVTAVLILGRFGVLLARGARKVGHFLDDWFGEPARPDAGQEARPSMPARLTAVEKHMGHMCDRLTDVDDRVQQIDHEMHPNSGASLRDAVNRIEAQAGHSTVHQTFVSPPPDDPGHT